MRAVAHLVLVRPMRLRITTTWQLFGLAGLFFLASCERVVTPDDASVGPEAACPAPEVQTRDWRVVKLERMGLRLKMPKRFSEDRGGVVIGGWVGSSFHAGVFENITVEITSYAGPGQSFEEQKAIRQTFYTGYSECAESIGGHRAIIQSFRGGGDITLGDRSFPSFAVFAIYDLAPGKVVRFRGDAATRQGQKDLLASVRTLEFQ